jgi:hypothetical protein
MTKTFLLVLCTAALSAGAAPEFSPEDRACQLPCENRQATPTPVAVSPLDKEALLARMTPSDAERRVELRRLIAMANQPRQAL